MFCKSQSACLNCLSEKVERRVVVGGSGEGGRRRVSFNFSSFNFATRPKPRLSSPLLNLTSSASLVSSKVSREASGERQHVKNNIGQCCPGWHKSLSPGTKQILSFQAHLSLALNAFQLALSSCFKKVVIIFCQIPGMSLNSPWLPPLLSPSPELWDEVGFHLGQLAWSSWLVFILVDLHLSWFSSQPTWLVILVGFHLGQLCIQHFIFQVGPLDRLSNRSDSVNELLDLEKHSPQSFLEDLDIPDLVQVVPDKEDEVPVRPVSPQYHPAAPPVTQRPPLSPISSLTRRSKQSEKSASVGVRPDQGKVAQELFKFDISSQNLDPPRQGLSLDLELGHIL